jgi:hypothetical protein
VWRGLDEDTGARGRGGWCNLELDLRVEFEVINTPSKVQCSNTVMQS